jgi:hypothetical protein
LKNFEAAIDALVNHLNTGGMMVIFNSNFRFEDSKAFSINNFEILATPSIKDSGFVYKFDKQNNRLTEPHYHCTYIKD